MIMDAFYRAHNNFPNGGNCLEFGVYVGDSFMRQALAINSKYKNSRLYGFDSWQGLPEETNGVWRPERHAVGQFCSTKDVVLDKMKRFGVDGDDRFILVDGFYSESLTDELAKKIGSTIFVNIDVDIHSSCVEVLNFIKPLLLPKTIIYFDDWKDPADQYDGKWGEHLAWEEFIMANPEINYKVLDINRYNQRYLEIM